MTLPTYTVVTTECTVCGLTRSARICIGKVEKFGEVKARCDGFGGCKKITTHIATFATQLEGCVPAEVDN